LDSVVFESLELHLAGASSHQAGTQREEAFEVIVVHLRDIHALLNCRPSLAVGAYLQVAEVVTVHDLQKEMIVEGAGMLTRLRSIFVNGELLPVGTNPRESLFIINRISPPTLPFCKATLAWIS